MYFTAIDPTTVYPMHFDKGNTRIDTKFNALEGISPDFVLLLGPIKLGELVHS